MPIWDEWLENVTYKGDVRQMEQKHFHFNEKKRVVVKIGSSSLNYGETGNLNFTKLEHLVRELCNLRNRGMDVCLVSSGAIAVGRQTLGMDERPKDISTKQACAAVGQARLMMIYQRLFAEYNQVAGQVLMTKNTMVNPVSRENAKNTFDELFRLGAIPIVNENDTVSTYEMQFGDNDTLSAIVASLIGADLLILLSDIDGLFTDDPHKNPDAKLIEVVEEMDASIYGMAKSSTGSDVGTGGMATKLTAAKIATLSGTDMIIANGKDVCILHHIFDDSFKGTIFQAKKKESFRIEDFILETIGQEYRKRSTMNQEQIDRINALYRKSKAEGLTEEEKKEQALLRKQYVADVKRNLAAQLNNIDMVNPDGSVENLGDKYGKKTGLS